jgi:hypothetical protein
MPQPYTVFKDNSSVPSANLTLVTPGTRVQLSSVSVPCAKVFLSAGRNNVGIITVGGATVVGANSGTSGNDMSALGSMTIEIDDLSKIWFDGTNANDTVSFAYLA